MNTNINRIYCMEPQIYLSDLLISHVGSEVKEKQVTMTGAFYFIHNLIVFKADSNFSVSKLANRWKLVTITLHFYSSSPLLWFCWPFWIYAHTSRFPILLWCDDDQQILFFRLKVTIKTTQLKDWKKNNNDNINNSTNGVCLLASEVGTAIHWDGFIVFVGKNIVFLL